MKFLLVSPFTNASGSAVRFWNIAIELKKLGHEVVFVDRKAVNSRGLYSSNAIRYYSCISTGNLFFDIVASLFYNFYIFFSNLNCDVYYALKPAPNNCIPALLARLLGKKIILDIDDLDFAYFDSKVKRKIFKVFFHFFPRFFPLITYHTPNLKEYLSRRVKISESRLYYLAQGISHEFLEINPADYNPPRKSLIYVATLGITSDFGDLIPIIKSLCDLHPDLSMSVVGDGCRRPGFEKEIQILGIEKQIHFTGRIDHKELPTFIASHSIGINYMHASEVNNCRAILKIREYLACGLEVVCNEVGDVKLFGNLIKVENDLDSLKNSLDQLLFKKNMRNLEGRAWVMENLCWKVIIERYLNYLNIAN